MDMTGDQPYKAYVVEEESGRFSGRMRNMKLGGLPPGDLLVRVHYSSLNYKDALSATGNRGVTREYPHTPGIDASGEVAFSDNPSFREGDRVIVTGFDLGMNTPGGFGGYIRVPSEWVVRFPENLTLKESMIFGTAGFTAAQSVLRLTESVSPEEGEIIVSGATGGVGCITIALLSKLNYQVAAVTGKESEHDFLTGLGATRILPRPTFETPDRRPLLPSQFAGAVDTVGGAILEKIIRSVKPGGTVTCCGNAASPHIRLTVYPFILRGVTLAGIASQNLPMESRVKIWELLAGEWKPSFLQDLYREIGLSDLPEHIEAILHGQIRGRTVVNMNLSPD